MSKLELSITFEPILRILRGIVSKQKWMFSLLILSGSYYLVVKDNQRNEIHYKVSCFNPGLVGAAYISLSNEFIENLSNCPIKDSRLLSLLVSIDTNTDKVEVSLPDYELVSEEEIFEWDGFLADSEDIEYCLSLEKVKKLVDFGSDNSVELVAVSGKYAYAYCNNYCEALRIEVNSTRPVRVALHHPKYLYCCLSKLLNGTESVDFLKSSKGTILCIDTELKLEKRQVLDLSIYYLKPDSLYPSKEVDAIEKLFTDTAAGKKTVIKQDAVRSLKNYIMVNKLDSDDLIQLTKTKRITVRLFNRYVASSGRTDLECYLFNNLLLIPANTEVLLTLYTEKKRTHERKPEQN